MKNIIPCFLLAACVVGLPHLSHAQLPFSPFGGHYPAGAEGIKGSSLPPPGVYLRDYNFFYFANEYPTGPFSDFNALAYVQAPRLIWITDYKILGGNYGMDVIVPFSYTDVQFKVPGYRQQTDTFGMGDIQLEPITLSWHQKNYDLALGYAIWAPSGNFRATDPSQPGKGYWSHMFTAGVTWYFDQQKTWALSLLNRYEIHHENDDVKVTPGHTYTLEWGLSKSLSKTVDVGLVGYYQQQVTDDYGIGASYDRSRHDHVVAFGPEVLMFCPKTGIFASLRYNYEVDARDRPQGHTFTITLTKRL